MHFIENSISNSGAEDLYDGWPNAQSARILSG
jgi:hypothetical protein